MKLSLSGLWCKQVGCNKSAEALPEVKPGYGKPPPARYTRPASTPSSRRQLLLGGATIVLAPLLVQQAHAGPTRSAISDSTPTNFLGFDGLGGSDSDYCTAEVQNQPKCAVVTPVRELSP